VGNNGSRDGVPARFKQYYGDYQAQPTIEKAGSIHQKKERHILRLFNKNDGMVCTAGVTGPIPATHIALARLQIENQGWEVTDILFYGMGQEVGGLVVGPNKSAPIIPVYIVLSRRWVKEGEKPTPPVVDLSKPANGKVSPLPKQAADDAGK